MTPAPPPYDPRDLVPTDDELVHELLRAIHDRLREIGAVDDALLAEVRRIGRLLTPRAPRRAD